MKRYCEVKHGVLSRSPSSRRRRVLGAGSGAAGLLLPGESVEEALGNVREAIELYLDVLRDEGREAPKDTDVVYQVSVAL